MNFRLSISMKKHHFIARIGLALMVGTLLLASCKKTPETVGNNLISSDNYIGVFRTDTVEIVCHSYFDTVVTKNSTNVLLGSMKDPVFGATEAGFYTQFRLSVAGQSFGANPVLDSLVLQLGISGYYGDTTVLQTVHAYELTDTLSVHETYYNNSEIAHDAMDLANSHQFRPHPLTKTNIVGTDTVRQAIVRIPLSQTLGLDLLTFDTTAYSQPDYFKEQFKGLYLTCDPVSQDGAITYFNLINNTITSLQLYYHDAATPDKVMRYDYYVTSSDTYFNHIDHDYTQGSPEFVSQLVDGQEETGQQTLYLQTMGGVRAHILFPNLSRWTEAFEGSHVVINEAKLILPAAQLSLDSTCYTLPSTLVLVGFNAGNTTYLLPDYYEGTSYFGGTYNSSKNYVSFRVSEYLQDMIMQKKDNLGLSLGINGASYNAQRMIINGPASTEENKMRLEVIYSLVNE